MNQTPSRSSPESPDFNRRDFIKGSSAATFMAMLGGTQLIAPQVAGQEKPATTQSGVPLKVAVIGCGAWGRDILNTLARLASADVVAVCDTYPAMVKRAKEAAPKAESYDDYSRILANKDIPAVIVATGSHQHKDVVIAALKAGKHVYCEAPLAHTVEDARAIAQAASKAVPFQNFQSGLAYRSDAHRKFVLDFVRAGAAGRVVFARTQWRKKQSWRRTSPNADREKELNWRLDSATSPGLIGELSIHQLDNVSLYLSGRPTAVTGFSSLMQWADGRDVPDSVQAVYEYPGGSLVTCEATLANSFDADYEMLVGTSAAVMTRANKAWMFQEVDAPLLGWEVYAKKDIFYKETGIALVAGASKLATPSEKAEEVPFTNTPLSFSLEAFIYNSDVIGATVKDFTDSFGADDKKAMSEAIAAAVINNKPAATWRDGYDATVIALKGNEAAQKKTRVEIPASLFEI